MLYNSDIQDIISMIEEIRQTDATLAEAARCLYQKENIPFDNIWPAIMKIRQLSEKEAMSLTKEWCIRRDND
jgi:hypothetical protein